MLSGRDRAVLETGRDQGKIRDLAESNRAAFGDHECRGNEAWLVERFDLLAGMGG
jgi:hypothetical protein